MSIEEGETGFLAKCGDVFEKLSHGEHDRLPFRFDQLVDEIEVNDVWQVDGCVRLQESLKSCKELLALIVLEPFADLLIVFLKQLI